MGKIKTNETLLSEAKKMLDPLEWEVLDVRRENKKILILVKHLICNTKSWNRKEKGRLASCSDPNCINERKIRTRQKNGTKPGGSKKKTDEQIFAEINELINPSEWKALTIERHLQTGRILVLMQHLNCGTEGWKEKTISRLTSCSNPICIQEKTKKTNLERRGVEFPMQDPNVREKAERTNLKRRGVRNSFQCPIVRSKIRITNLKKYGVGHPSQSPEIQARRNITNLERRGVQNPFQDPEIQTRIRQTHLEIRGVEYPMQDPNVREKARLTNLVKRGVEYPTQCSTVRSKIRSTNLKRHKVEWFVQHPRAFLKSKESRPNRLFKKLLEKNNIEFSQEKAIENFLYDFCMGQTVIEINPSATHNSTHGVHGKPPKVKDYHKRKLQAAQRAGFHCIHVFDWDDKEKIINLLKSKTNLPARVCEIKEISLQEAQGFLNLYHLQGAVRNQKICLGLFYNNILIGLMTFGKPRYNINYQWELIRLCFHSDYQVIGGSEKLFNYFVKTYHPKSILSYCDLAKFNGNIYSKLGFSLLRTSSPSIHWHRKNWHILDSSLRMRGFDILVGKKLGLDPYGKGTSNEELMIRHKFVKIYDCGKQTWVWLKEGE